MVFGPHRQPHEKDERDEGDKPDHNRDFRHHSWSRGGRDPDA
jgi:hypothetical protein